MGITITGIKEVDLVLKDLPANLQKKVLRQALRSALKPMATAIKADAPVGEDRDLAGSVKVRAARKKTPDTITMLVGYEEKTFKGERFYAAHLEYGTSKMKPSGFMRRAFDTTKDQTLAKAIADIVAGVERLASI